VLTQDGAERLFFDDLVKDKIVVISFIYTSCTDMCPLTTARLGLVRDQLGEAMGRDIFFVTLTVDPERDTPDRIKAFAAAFDAGPGWSFVTGKPEHLRAITRSLGDRSTPDRLHEHRNEIVIGNDAANDWQRDSAMGDLDRLVVTIRQMDPTWREPPRPAGQAHADTGYILDTQPGQGLFKKVCAPCHTIGVGDRVGPDLRDVTARRERKWLLEFISDPGTVRGRRDPIALSLAAKFPAVRMPRMGLSEIDASDLLAYLDAESRRLASLATAAEDRPAARDVAHRNTAHRH
jgi:mono/diheme cytochrome c family protein